MAVGITDTLHGGAAARWNSDASGLTVEASWDLLADIDRDVVAGFNKIPHGGIEVGGILFGRQAGETIRVLAFRPSPCTYASGPRYQLSPQDTANFTSALSAPESDPDLHGMVPVGWYHSQTRAGTSLTAGDLALHRSNFPEPWQVALVLRPRAFEPTRGTWYFVEPEGNVQEPYGEFEIPKPASGHRGVSRQDAPPDSPQGALGPEDRPESVPDADPAAVYDPFITGIAPAPVAEESRAYAGRERPAPRRGRGILIWACAVTALLIAALPLLYRTVRLPESAVALRLSDNSGQLHIEWNREAQPVLQARRGYLDIDDSGSRMRIDLDDRQLRDGSVVYSRLSPTVLVRMIIEQPGAPALEESMRFVGAPVRTAEIPASVPAPVSALPPAAPVEPAAPASAPPVLNRDRDAAALSRADRSSWEAAPPRAAEPRRPAPPSPRRFQPQLKSKSAAAPSAPVVDAPPVVLRSQPIIDPVLPSAADRVAPPPAAAPRTPALPAAASPRAPALPPRRIIWTGKVERRGVVEIEAGRGSIGHLSGALPAAPGTLTIMPGEMTSRGLRLYTSNARLSQRSDPPGPENGWNATEYVWDPERAGDITILEAPGAQNGWNRVVFRSERRAYSILVLRWDPLPPGR